MRLNGKLEECKHGMIPAWCADCKGLKTPEEEVAEEDRGVDAFIKKVWGR